jgi:seryl-tRNA synthetase
MDYFDENQRLIFPPSLQKLIDQDDLLDVTLFEQINFRHNSASIHGTLQSPRKKAGSNETGRLKTPTRFISSPLPSLPPDSETAQIKKNVEELERQRIDLDIQIDSLKSDIEKIEKQIKSVENQLNKSNGDYTKVARTPNTQRRLPTPKSKDNEDYKARYEKLKMEYDGMIKVLNKQSMKPVRVTTAFKG